MQTHLRNVSIASGNNLSLAVAGNLSLFERMSSSAAVFIASRSRATSSSAKLSNTSSLAFFFLGLLLFLLFRISSIFMSNRSLFAKLKKQWNIMTFSHSRKLSTGDLPCSGGSSLRSTGGGGCLLFLFLCSPLSVGFLLSELRFLVFVLCGLSWT